MFNYADDKNEKYDREKKIGFSFCADHVSSLKGSSQLETAKWVVVLVSMVTYCHGNGIIIGLAIGMRQLFSASARFVMYNVSCSILVFVVIMADKPFHSMPTL